MADKTIVMPSPTAVVSQEFNVGGIKFVYTARDGVCAEMIVETAQQFSYAIRMLRNGHFMPADNIPDRPDYGKSVHGEPRVVFYVLDRIPVRWNDDFLSVKPNKFTEDSDVSQWLDVVHDMMLANDGVSEQLQKAIGIFAPARTQNDDTVDEHYATAPPDLSPATIIFEDTEYTLVPLVANYRDIPEYEVGTNIALRIEKIKYKLKENLDGEDTPVYDMYCKLPGDHLKFPIAMTIYADSRMLTGNIRFYEELAAAAPHALAGTTSGSWYLLGKTYRSKTTGKQAFWYTHLIERTYSQP